MLIINDVVMGWLEAREVRKRTPMGSSVFMMNVLDHDMDGLAAFVR